MSVAKKLLERCQDCRSCEELIPCPANFEEKECIGCMGCYIACPFEAIEMKEQRREREISIEVDGKIATVPERITVGQALEGLGYKVVKIPDGGLFAPCGVGGCYSCVVEVDGIIRRGCITPVREGMRIKTRLPTDYTPKRIVGGFSGHMVGGVGTPWYLKSKASGYYIEAACFTAGCNFRCPQCQNWITTCQGKGKALTPKEAAELMSVTRRITAVDRMAISGGECTLNRQWLLQYIKELKALNPDKDARIHVDTNGSLLTKDYIDELVDAGMTDIGIDLKSLYTETFMRITGLKDGELAENYKKTAWEATRYIIERYKEKVFLGIGIPFNKDLISLQEISEMGREIVKIDRSIQVCVLDYFPQFRKRDISRPSYLEMIEVYKVLKETGLKTVICQTTRGYIGP